jgi:tetratricopeptide (TPR) repeat protein
VLTLLHLGAVQEEKENFAAAERYLNEAIELEKQSLPPSQHQYSKELAGLFQNLGNAQRGNGKLLEAEQSYASGLRIRRNLVRHDPDIFSQDLALSLRNFGDLRLAQNNLREAEKLLSEAKDLVEKIREKALTIDERNRLMQDNDLTYIALLECYVKLKDRKKVLEIAEQGKSRSLSDLLNLKSSDWQPKAPTPDTVVEVKKLGEDYSRIVRELQQIERYETFLSEYLPESNVETTEQWHEEKLRVQNEKFAKHSEFERVLADIAKYDKNFPPKARHIDTETIFEISRNLNRTIVMFRILRKSTAIIFVFPDSELQIEEVMGFGQQEMFDLFRDHWFLPYAQWKQGDLSDVDPWQGAIVRMLDLIYERLLGHVHRTLKKKSGSREILFVPTKSLARLPLHAASWTNSNGKKHYLCEEYTISYAPSVSVFKRCLENEKQRSNTALLIADPTADLAASAAEEVACIQQLIPQNNKLAGPDASKSRVMAALQEDYGFTHFCCHGFYSQANPFDSGLYMHHDEVIWLSDIINCNLQNNWLTTLSACETGMVDFQSPTDEHFSLPLGFIFAGSPSVWASLWMVSNQATSTLMQRAYENLNSEEYKNNKPEALRQAQLSMLDDSHPFYWASFQHFGI